MKTIALILSISFFALLGCKKSLDPLPAQVWSSGCVELAPFEGAYRLSGMCCEYILLPTIKTSKKGDFKVQGSFHSYTGAGFSNIPIEITGDLSSSDTTLTLRYYVNDTGNLFILKSGKAKEVCECICY